MILASTAVVIASLYLAREVLLPFALAILLSFLLTPLVSRLEKWGLSRIVAVVVVTMLVVGAVGVLGFVVARQVTTLADSLPQYEDNIRAKARALGSGTPFRKATETLEQIGKEVAEEAKREEDQENQRAAGPFDIPGAEAEPIPVQVVPNEPTPLEVIAGTLAPLIGPVTMVGVTLVLVVMILVLREDLRDRFIRLIGLTRIDMTTKALDEATRRISRYLLMQLIVNVTYGVPVGIGLYLIGVPNAILWGVLATLLRFIPFLGPWLAALMPITLSLAVFDDWYAPVAVVLLFLILELISNNIMEPWLYGMRTGISPMAVVAAAIFWTWVWGPVGLIVSTPITVCLVVLGRYAPQLEFLYVMLSDEPVLEPRSRFYQRLLAMDYDDSIELAEEFFRERTLLAVYDEIMAPALRLIERDRHRGRLDDATQEFIYATVREIIEDAGEAKKDLEVRISRATSIAAESPAATEQPVYVAERGALKVLCLPARDTADELAAMMFTQVLQSVGYDATAGSVDALASEHLEHVAQADAKLVCVSAIPPSAALHARYMCKRLSARFPDLPQIIALWEARDPREDLVRRLGCANDPVIVTSFREGLEQVRRMVQPMLVSGHEGTKGRS